MSADLMSANLMDCILTMHLGNYLPRYRYCHLDKVARDCEVIMLRASP